MKFRETWIASRRLALLRLLREAGGAANESVLRQGLSALGFNRETREDIRADLNLFREAGLVTQDWFENRLVVATLTDRGLDVAAGRIEVEGIERPDRVG